MGESYIGITKNIIIVVMLFNTGMNCKLESVGFLWVSEPDDAVAFPNTLKGLKGLFPRQSSLKKKKGKEAYSRGACCGYI